MWRTLLVSFGLIAMIPSGLRAQGLSPALQAELKAEDARIQELWKTKQFETGLKILKARAESTSFSQLDSRARAGVFYNMACAASLLKRNGEALAFLGESVGQGFKEWGTLNTDTDLDGLRHDAGFLWLSETVQRRGDFLAILRTLKDYAPSVGGEAPAFVYQSKDAPDLIKLRQLCQLEKVAGKGSELERIVNLMRWVHAQVRHDGESNNPEPKNALHLLEVCRTEKRGINCRMMATILNEVYLSLGFPSRQVTCLPLDDSDPDCHVITTVWSSELGKWLYMDPTFEAYFMDEKGQLLSIAEARARLIANEPLELSKGANWNGQPKDPVEYKNYMAKNLARITCPLESAYGYESWPKNRGYVTLDSTGFPARPAKDLAGPLIHDPEKFWANPASSSGHPKG